MIDATKIIEDYRRFFASFLPGIFRITAKNLPLLVSTSITHSGDDEDSGDSGIISLFVLLESPESSRRIQLRNACVFHCQAHHVNAVSRHRRVPPFASSRRPLTHALAHLQWQEPRRFIDASATSRESTKEPSPLRGRTTRPLRASPRHPWLSLRRRRMSSCGAETHLLFTGHSTIDASDTKARAAPGVMMMN